MGRVRKDATPPETPPKKDRLTLTQLAGYDDILTDALVDHVRLHLSTRSYKVTPMLITCLGVFLDHNSEESVKIQPDAGNQ